MKHQLIFLLLGINLSIAVCAQPTPAPFDKQKITVYADWLKDPIKARADIYKTNEGHLVFTNGLVSRTFTLTPCLLYTSPSPRD